MGRPPECHCHCDEPSSSSSSSSSSSVPSSSGSSSSSAPIVPIPYECGDCPADVLPTCWEFAYAGVTDAACTRCLDINRTWILTHVDDPELCEWRSEIVPLQRRSGSGCIFNATGRWTLSFEDIFSPTLIILTLNAGGAMVSYAILKSSYVCGDNLVMPISGVGNPACTNWPTSVTLVPVACP